MDSFSQSTILQGSLNTILILLGLWLGRSLLIKTITKSSRSSEAKLEWTSRIRTISHVLALAFLLIIWGGELKTFALSLVAIAAAVVIATKELLLCFLGGMLKLATRPFKAGDRIELAGYRGDVINHDFFVINLIEIGPERLCHEYTGRRITLPNALLLSHGLVNETKRFKYGLHSFKVCQPISCDALAHQQALLQAASEVSRHNVTKAQEYMKRQSALTGLEEVSAEPRVSVAFPTGKIVEFIVRVPIEALRAARTEQAILQRYLGLLEKQQPPAEDNS